MIEKRFFTNFQPLTDLTRRKLLADQQKDNRLNCGAVDNGSVLRIERTGSAVKYYINSVLVYTSGATTTAALLVDASLYHVGATLKNIRTSFAPAAQTIKREFDYDHVGRLLKTWHSVNGGTAVLLAANEYNELGQLVDKKLHSINSGTTYKQSVDHRYNIRGWLTSMNNSQLTNDGTKNDDTGDFFGMELGYNNSIGTSNAALYNGNISGMKWSRNLALGVVKDVAYNYSYDAMNRITAAAYKKDTVGGWLNTSGAYSESGYSYDLNGNIMGLTRKTSFGASLDVLTYNYGSGSSLSNKLLSVTDGGDDDHGFIDGNTSGSDYGYDANGNMTMDKNKGILADYIAYNHMNLPRQVWKTGGDYMKYIYDATGRKLRQEVYNSSNLVQKGSDYAGEFFYENDTLKFINHEEGRIITTGYWKDAPQVIPYSNCSSYSDFDETPNSSDITISNYTSNGETYLKVLSNVTNSSTPGVLSDLITVEPGEQYQVRLRGYRTTSSNVYLYVHRSSGADIVWGSQLLPYNPAGEAWISATFTVPAGVTQIQVGALFNHVVSGDAFYINTIELNKYDASRGTQEYVSTNNEYQYNLKDHLGNVRMTFTTRPDSESKKGTLEDENIVGEQGNFLRYANTKRVYSSLLDHTNGNALGYSERLNGSTNEKFGLARSISVMPGDTVKAEVYAKYLDPTTANWSGPLTTLAGQISGGTGGVVIDGAAYSTSTSTFPYPSIGITSGSSGSGPKAFLNWLVFDRNYVLVDFGFDRMTTAAKEAGSDVAHEKLESDNIYIREAGYVYIYISNEETTPVEVFFDDLKVTQGKSPVVQTDDYYPFGLAFNEYQRESSLINNYQYNGKEKQDELNLGWLDYEARMYIPEIGRWTTIDPLAEQSRKWSSYAYGYDNPVLFVDPDGMQNIVYLYANKGDDGGGPTRKEMRQIKRGFNQWAKANNLDTRAKVINHVPNASRLDKSDHFIAVGTDQSNKDLNSQSSATGYDHLSEGSLDGRAATADMTDPSNKGNISYMNIESLREGFATKENEAVDNFAGTTFTQYVGGVALHETGHSSSLTHSTPGYFGGDPTKVDESRGSYDAHDTRRFNFMSTERQWETEHTFNSNMSTILPVQRKIFTDKFNGTPIARIRRRK